MGKGYKIFFWSALAFFVGKTIINVKALVDNVIIDIKRPSYIATLSGLSLTVHASITNPSNTGAVIYNPFVRLFAGNQELTRAAVLQPQVVIPANGTVEIPVSLSEISWITLFKLISQINATYKGTIAEFILDYKTALKDINLTVEYSFTSYGQFLKSSKPIFE